MSSGSYSQRGPLKPEQEQGEEEDLKNVLTEFWLGAMNTAPDWTDRMKAAELLAKYILGEGRSAKVRRHAARATTADILRIASQLEASSESEDEEVGE